jgi:hypothetical protein
MLIQSRRHRPRWWHYFRQPNLHHHRLLNYSGLRFRFRRHYPGLLFLLHQCHLRNLPKLRHHLIHR